MVPFVLRRILQVVVVVFVVICLNFTIIALAPGDAVTYFVGQYSEALDSEYVQMLRARYGLDQPLQIRLLTYITNVLRGDLGYSTYFRAPVMDIILARLPNTLLLMLSAILIELSVGIPLGIICSRKTYSLTDNTITFFSIVGCSLPLFWLGQMLVLVFAFNLGIFPVQGLRSTRLEISGMKLVLDILWHLILPAITLATMNIALMVRLTRANMLEVLREDYITTAWAKGLSQRKVYYKHAFKNALLPIVTVIGYRMGFMFAGATITETIFNWPGIGRLMFDSITRRDFPVIMGQFIFVAIAVAVSNFVVDIAYSYLDPRIRYR